LIKYSCLARRFRNLRSRLFLFLYLKMLLWIIVVIVLRRIIIWYELWISILRTSVFILNLSIILSRIHIFLKKLMVIIKVFPSWRFTYDRRVLSCIHNRSWRTCRCSLWRRHLSCGSLLMIPTNFVHIYGCFGTLFNASTILWQFWGIWDTPNAMLLVCFWDVTSKSWLISCVIIIVLINSGLGTSTHSYWWFWHLLL
jgi:hypothetical protein